MGREYSMLEVMKETGVKSKATIVRYEEQGVFPTCKRRKTTKARIFTDEHIAKIKAHREATEDPPEKPTRTGEKGTQ